MLQGDVRRWNGEKRERKFGQIYKNASIDSRRLIVILVLHCNDVHCSVGFIVHKFTYCRRELSASHARVCPVVGM